MSGKNPLGNSREPQSYEGVNVIVPVGGWQLIKSTGSTARDPTTNDKKYPIGSIWVNTLGNSAWILTNSAAGVANWELLSADTTSTVISGTTQQLQVNQAYITNNSSLTTLTLPITAPVGSIISIQGNGTGGWTIAQNAGQQIVMNSSSTTVGTSGSVSSTNRFNAISLIAVTGGTSTVWAVNDFSGTFTFV